MEKRKILYILIAIICVISIICGVYYQIFLSKPSKQNSPSNEIVDPGIIDNGVIDPEILKDEFNSLFNNSFDSQGYNIASIQKRTGFEEEDIIYSFYSLQEDKDGKYNVDINLPVFNVQSDVASEFNSITQSIFINKANDVLVRSEEYTVYNVEFVGYLNNNILSLVIKSTLKEGNNPQRVIVQTYNYDIITGNKVTLNEVLENEGLKLKDVNEKIEKQVEEAKKQAEAVSNASGKTIYKRDINNAMYVTDNVNYFFIGLDGQIYIVYPYGNSNFTSEIDIIKI